MKKFLKVTLLIMLFTFTTKVFATELDYQWSEWSTMYPDTLDEKLIESEVRYKWYRFENGEVEYTDEYYTNLEGYTRDDKSATTFYRYIMGNLLLDAHNNIIYNDDYCRWNFCYLIYYHEPTLVETSGKNLNEYTEDDIVEIESVAAPFTFDGITQYFIIGFISLLLTTVIIVTKKKKSLKRE